MSNIDPKQAVDLQQHMQEKATSDAQREAEAQVVAQQAQREAEDFAQRWDAAMTKTFKGIVSRPKRHRLLMSRSPFEGEE